MSDADLAIALAKARRAKGGVSTNSEAVAEFERKMKSMAAGAVNGASFGFADEATGVLGGMGSMARGEGFGPGYTSARDRVRDTQDVLQATEPGQYSVGNIAGAMAPAIAAGPLATGKSLVGNIGRGIGVGAIEGALHGAGNANGEDFAGDAMRGAGIGAALGGAAPAVVRGLGAIKNAAKDPATGLVDGMLNRGNASKANRAILAALQNSKKNPDDLSRALMQAAQDGQPEFRMMDALGLAGQRQASGITRGGGDAATELAEFLEQRQMGQSERVGSFVEDAFGFRGQPSGQQLPMMPGTAPTQAGVLSQPQTSAASLEDALRAARGEAASVAYGAARGNAAPVDVRDALGVIDSRIGGMQGSGVAGDAIDSKLSAYRSRLAAQPGPDGVNRELSDFDRVLGVKQSVQDDIGAAIRAGRNNEARELKKLEQALDSALEGSSEMYRGANDGYRNASRVIDAVGEGAAMSRPSARAADTVPQFGAMAAEQQRAARVGYGDRLLAQMEANAAPTANKAKPLQSPKRAQEAQAMALDAQRYSERLARENAMWETQNKALGGSRTADNLQDIEGANDMASGALGVGRSIANFQIGDAVSKSVGMLAPLAKGQNDATRQMIARALMSKDPVKALAPVLRQEKSSESRRRIIEALLRNAGRELTAD